MSFDFTTTKAHLTETEKDRIVCLYLCSDKSKINNEFDWEAATTAYGSASVESMRVSLRNTIKKLDKVLGTERQTATAARVEGSKAVTPPVTPNKGRKRKAQPAPIDAEGMDGGGVAAPKVKKSRGRKKIKKEDGAGSDHAAVNDAAVEGEKEVKEEIEDEDCSWKMYDGCAGLCPSP